MPPLSLSPHPTFLAKKKEKKLINFFQQASIRNYSKQYLAMKIPFKECLIKVAVHISDYVAKCLVLLIFVSHVCYLLHQQEVCTKILERKIN